MPHISIEVFHLQSALPFVISFLPNNNLLSTCYIVSELLTLSTILTLSWLVSWLSLSSPKWSLQSLLCSQTSFMSHGQALPFAFPLPSAWKYSSLFCPRWKPGAMPDGHRNRGFWGRCAIEHLSFLASLHTVCTWARWMISSIPMSWPSLYCLLCITSTQTSGVK